MVQTITCSCGEEILIVPDVKAMSKAIREHTNKTHNGAAIIEDQLTEKLLIALANGAAVTETEQKYGTATKDLSLAKQIAKHIAEHGTHALGTCYGSPCVDNIDDLTEEIQKVFDKMNNRGADVCPRCGGKVVLEYSEFQIHANKVSSTLRWICEKCETIYGYGRTLPEYMPESQELYDWTTEYQEFVLKMLNEHKLKVTVSEIKAEFLKGKL